MTNTKKDTTDFDIFSINLEEIAKNTKLVNEKQIDTETLKKYCSELIKRVATNTDSDIKTATIATLLLLQSGAYLKGVSNRNIKLNDKEFSKRDLSISLETIKSNKSLTLRNIAYGLRDEMVQASRLYNVPGNLFARFKTQYSEQIAKLNDQETFEHSLYCTDVQSDNPKTPALVKEFLAKRKIGKQNK